MKEIKAYVKPNMLDSVVDALAALPEIPGITMIKVHGYGHAKEGGAGILVDYNKLEIVVSNAHVETVTNIIIEHARTGVVGDGKIFISEVEEAIRIRTGERGPIALAQQQTISGMDENR